MEYNVISVVRFFSLCKDQVKWGKLMVLVDFLKGCKGPKYSIPCSNKALRQNLLRDFLKHLTMPTLSLVAAQTLARCPKNKPNSIQFNKHVTPYEKLM